MNEDENGITPADVTAMTIEPHPWGGCLLTIEQGNGDLVKTIQLTEMERIQLSALLGAGMTSVNFVDIFRPAPAAHP